MPTVHFSTNARAWGKWVFTFTSTLPEMEWRATRGLIVQNPYPSIGILAQLTLPQSVSVRQTHAGFTGLTHSLRISGDPAFYTCLVSDEVT